MKDDMISRQAAINALGEEPPVWYDGEDELAERNQWRRDVAAIKALPPAQPEITNEEIRFVLKQLRVYFAIKIRDGKDGGVPVELLKLVEEIQEYFENTPSAQPGWIPCTPETMPKNKSNVLTVIYIPGRQAHIRSGWYEDGLFMNDNGDTWKATDKEVVGWMYQPKLPKPWEGDANG